VTPLLHHITTSNLQEATPEAKVAAARLVVKDFGADAISHYPCNSVNLSPLNIAASHGALEMMDFLISGR